MKGGFTSIFVEVENEEYLVANLSEKCVNESLNLNFNTGDKICFKVSVSLIMDSFFESEYFLLYDARSFKIEDQSGQESFRISVLRINIFSRTLD